MAVLIPANTPFDAALRQRCVEQKDEIVSVLVDGHPVDIAMKWLSFNLIFWKPLVRRGLPIKKKHLFHNECVTDSAIQRIQNAIMDDIIDAGMYTSEVITPTPDMPWHLRLGVLTKKDAFLWELMEMQQELFQFIGFDLQAHQRSMSIYNMAKVLAHPRVKEARQIDFATAENLGIHAVEEALKKTYARVLDACMDPSIPNNDFYGFLLLGLVSQQQLVQNACSAGTRTDVGDDLIRHPIRSSFMGGLTDIECAIDSRAGMKSAIYNIVGMPQAQYPNRKQQLLASSVYHLYRGDCGTTVTVPFLITERNHAFCIGKLYKMPDGKLYAIRRENSRALIGHTLQLRSPGGCHHTDGVCEVCMGELAIYNFHDNIVVGIAAVIALMEPVGQLILSNKHLARTSSIAYTLPDPLKAIMFMAGNEIYISAHTRLDTLGVGIPHEKFRINDLAYVDTSGNFNDQYFSSIAAISIGDAKTRTAHMPDINMVSNARGVPYLTAEALTYIKNNPDLVHRSGTIWIDLSKWDTKQPFMRCVVANDSMVRFSGYVEKYFSTIITRERSYPAALQYFSDYVYRMIGTNLAHIEVCLRASMITSQLDYRIPRVTDVTNVSFGGLGYIIPNRSIGAQLAFEKCGAVLRTPRTFVLPKQPNVMDKFVGFNPPFQNYQ